MLNVISDVGAAERDPFRARLFRTHLFRARLFWARLFWAHGLVSGVGDPVSGGGAEVKRMKGFGRAATASLLLEFRTFVSECEQPEEEGRRQGSQGKGEA